mmetsp:Transcript_3175/g.4330  ORF Transcript_3175/g.4330 Transcript_3175/m.4330 type:complete len:81 (-) Transcript_3175:53-295(-)
MGLSFRAHHFYLPFMNGCAVKLASQCTEIVYTATLDKSGGGGSITQKNGKYQFCVVCSRPAPSRHTSAMCIYWLGSYSSL